MPISCSSAKARFAPADDARIVVPITRTLVHQVVADQTPNPRWFSPSVSRCPRTKEPYSLSVPALGILVISWITSATTLYLGIPQQVEGGGRAEATTKVQKRRTRNRSGSWSSFEWSKWRVEEARKATSMRTGRIESGRGQEAE